VQVNLFIFDRFPQPLDKHVVAPAAFAIHADGDAVILEQLCKFQAGKLTALIGIEDFRRA
jgi:hypothetical protein